MIQEYDLLKLKALYENQEISEVIAALDQVLFAACMYYLNVEGRGIPFPEDSCNILNVRHLLDCLRKCKVG